MERTQQIKLIAHCCIQNFRL